MLDAIRLVCTWLMVGLACVALVWAEVTNDETQGVFVPLIGLAALAAAWLLWR